MAPKTRTVVREGVDVIASGGMDDIVRLWDVTPDGELKLKYKLPDHSLGVVSVALNKEVTRELPFLYDFVASGGLYFTNTVGIRKPDIRIPETFKNRTF